MGYLTRSSWARRMARALGLPPHQLGVGVKAHLDRQVDVFLTVRTQNPNDGVAPKSQSSPTVEPRSVRESGLPESVSS